jgi:uncharacterized protein with ParB-like and HNH nuclease domain
MERVEYEKLIVQDIINLYKSKELNLTPWYQRRSIWTTPQQAYLINTLFEQKPIPSLYIRHSLDVSAEKSIREIVDGQQRIRAILDYSENVFPAKHPAYKKKVLCRELKRSELEKFKLTSLSVGYLLGATDEDVVEIFGRLNSVSKTLNAQEKRNAKFSGDYKQFCLREAAKRLPIWRNLNIFSANDVSRMQEVQFVSDLGLNYLNGLSDFSNTALDKIYKQYDEAFPPEEKLQRRFERVFNLVAALPPVAVRDTIFNRQPLFFSLCIVLDSAKGKMSPESVATALHKIDAMFAAKIDIADRKKDEAEFITACTASTQRIKSRQIRHAYLKKAIE